MKLADWLKDQNKTPDDFAGLVKVGRSTVYRWLDENKPEDQRVRPSRRQMAEIVKVTDGSVTANDFWGEGSAPNGNEPATQSAA